MKKKSQAPALTRGLEILKLLNQEPDLTVEEMAKQTGYPRASLFRILGTLIDFGAVSKKRDNTGYRASMMLLPVHTSRKDFQDRILTVLNNLSQRTGHTAEWYVPDERGMVLVMRREPTGQEVTVRAGIGFVRPWTGELDAVAAVAYAFSDRRPATAGFWTYVTDGKQGKLTRREVEKRIQTANKEQCLADTAFNSNGVRRSAAVVFDAEKMAGVIAVAECMNFRTETPAEKPLSVLREEIKTCDF